MKTCRLKLVSRKLLGLLGLGTALTCLWTLVVYRDTFSSTSPDYARHEQLVASSSVVCPPAAVCAPPPPTSGPSKQLRTVYVVTPTYPRAVQIPELTRLSQTLMHAPHVFWVVTEDAETHTPAVTQLLQRTGLSHVHILGPKPSRYKDKSQSHVPRGVSNRLAALQWVRKSATAGVVYFADDDNAYDYRLFFELSRTRGISVFPVGLVTDYGLSTPVVRQGRVVGFYDGWVANREFPMDMAGFAVSVELLLKYPEATMPFVPGYEEDGLMKSLKARKEDFELLADNCTKILVWHTQTKPRGPFTHIDLEKHKGTNLELLSPQVLQKPTSLLTKIANVLG